MFSFETNLTEKIDDEIWKPITYPGIVPNEYSISSYRNIKDIKTGKILKQYLLIRDIKTENVYYIIKLKFIDFNDIVKYKNYRVNRLVGWEYCKNRDLTKNSNAFK